jgi:hypothetical protein
MKRLMQSLMELIGASSMSTAERYLARAVDAHDLECRIQALERYRG